MSPWRWAMALWCTAAMADPATLPTALLACRAHVDAAERLRCYDHLDPGVTAGARLLAQGHNEGQDIPLTLAAPATLWIVHDDAILVATLETPEGEILRNLHLAGPGRLRVPVTVAGDYRLRLSATGRWTVHLRAD